MRYIGMEEVGGWGDPREGFILTKPYMARRHVRQTDAPGSTGATFFFLILTGGARAPSPGSAASLG